MENPEELNVGEWVDEQLGELHPTAGWDPNSEEALARLRELHVRAARRRQVKSWVLLSALAVAGLLFLLPATRSKARLDAAPDFELENIAGGKSTAADLKGKVTVVDMWATWCEPCIREIPSFNKLHEAYEGKDVAIVGITVESPHHEIAAKAREFGMKYLVLVGNDDVVAGFGGLLGFPTTFVLTKDWKIYKSYMGLLPNKHEKIRQDIDRLLAEDQRKS
jgi:thiol-disulfide isomerase/thioredoxin